jgi:hypothetical protein
MKSKPTFTRAEADAIVELIKQKLKADSIRQKAIRDKIRKLGFYASDYGFRDGYTVEQFLSVAKIVGSPASKVVTKPQPTPTAAPKPPKPAASNGSRGDSDEAYIIDLCDKVLQQKAIRQHKFDFLRGDAGTMLPVDAWYPSLNLVIEYRERQHTEAVAFFDKRITRSGVPRGEQRKLYDQLRRDLLPKHGIKIIELGYADFEHHSNKRLKRLTDSDLQVLKRKLASFL